MMRTSSCRGRYQPTKAGFARECALPCITESPITDSAAQTLTPQNGHLIKILVSLYFAITSDVAVLAIFFIAYLSRFKSLFLCIAEFVFFKWQ